MGSFDTTRRGLGVLLVLLVVVAASCAGTRRWASLYNGPLNFTDAPSSIAVGGKGKTVVVTGSSYGVGTGQDYATVAYDAVNGDRRWVARYNGPTNGDDAATSLAVSADGRSVFVTGTSYVEQGPDKAATSDYATVAYNVADGRQRWAARFNPSSIFDVAKSIAVSPDGRRVFVTGRSAGTYATVAYNADDGIQLWVARYTGPANAGDDATNITVSPDGSKVFVSGSSHSANGLDDYATVAYNAVNGAQVWVIRYNGPGNSADDVTGLAVSPDGTKVFVTGRSGGSTTGLDYATVAYNAAGGTQLWVARYNGPANEGDGATGLAVSPDGTKVFVTGFGRVSPSLPEYENPDYATVAYNTATGTQQWVALYNGPGNVSDGASSVATSPDGASVFVTGFSSDGVKTQTDYGTVAYNAATGTQRWVALYNGPGTGGDYATSIAASPDGKKVFVTGFTNAFSDEGFPPPTAPPPGLSQDYATVAYDAS